MNIGLHPITAVILEEPILERCVILGTRCEILVLIILNPRMITRTLSSRCQGSFSR